MADSLHSLQLVKEQLESLRQQNETLKARLSGFDDALALFFGTPPAQVGGEEKRAERLLAKVIEEEEARRKPQAPVPWSGNNSSKTDTD